jgi:carbonic anhydrase
MQETVIKVFTKDEQDAITPEDAFTLLKQGNERFVSGKSLCFDHLTQARKLEAGQYPWTVILSCIDSRTAPEIVFDLGLGDAFNIRVPGNILSPVTLGGVEFSIEVAGAKLIAVIGHNSCGAVTNACKNVRIGNITYVVDALEPVVDVIKGYYGTQFKEDNMDFIIQKVAEENVRYVMSRLTRRSLLIRERVNEGKLKIVGGLHDIGSGQITWVE